MSESSQERIDANKANAQFSTGPRTRAGKARVSQNARTHGLTGERLRIEPEDQEAYDHLRALQLVEHNPQDSTEQHLFEEILRSMWIVERSGILQSEIVDADGCDGLETEDESLRKQHDRLERYHTRAQNSWIRCRKILKVLQNERIAKQTQSGQDRDAAKAANWMANLNPDPPIPAEEQSPQDSAPPPPSEAELSPDLAAQFAILDPNDPDAEAKGKEMIRLWFAAELAKIPGV